MQRGYTTLTKGSTASGDATLTVGAMTAGSVSVAILVSVLPSTPADLNVLGSTGFQYAPALISFCTEENNAAGAVADILNGQQTIDFVGTILKRGAITKWYKTANTTAPSIAGIIAANLKATFAPSVEWQHLSST